VVAGSESLPETASASSAVGPSTDIGASKNIALTVLQCDVCSRLENEIGFKLKNAIDDKSLRILKVTEEHIRDLYGRYHQLKSPEEKEVLTRKTLNRQLSEKNFTLDDLAFILYMSRASAQRLYDIFRNNNSE
jgi:hypothetical protein